MVKPKKECNFLRLSIFNGDFLFHAFSF